jgi:hypothetical protein
MQRARRQRTPQQPNLLINPDEEWQCRWWSRELGVTPRQLREAIRRVGPMSNAVRAYLGSGDGV